MDSMNSAISMNENRGINLWLVPIRCGNIVLPEIWINGKRGIWVNSLITDIKSNWYLLYFLLYILLYWYILLNSLYLIFNYILIFYSHQKSVTFSYFTSSIFYLQEQNIFLLLILSNYPLIVYRYFFNIIFIRQDWIYSFVIWVINFIIKVSIAILN